MIPVPLIISGVSALGSLLSKDEDPNSEMRAMIQKLMQEVAQNEPAMANAIQMRGAQNLGLLQNQLTDRGAAAGLPENVTLQNLSKATLGSRNNVEEALAGLKERTFAQKAQLAGMIPEKPQSNPWGSLLGIAGQAAFNDPKSMGFLSNLFGGGGKSIAGPPGWDMSKLVGFNPMQNTGNGGSLQPPRW